MAVKHTSLAADMTCTVTTSLPMLTSPCDPWATHHQGTDFHDFFRRESHVTLTSPKLSLVLTRCFNENSLLTYFSMVHELKHNGKYTGNSENHFTATAIFPLFWSWSILRVVPGQHLQRCMQHTSNMCTYELFLVHLFMSHCKWYHIWSRNVCVHKL